MRIIVREDGKASADLVADLVAVVQLVVRSSLLWVLLPPRVVRQWPLVASPAGP